MDGMKVVVVSDRAGDFSAVVRLLTGQFPSLAVAEAEGGEEGMRVLAAEEPDLALVAVRMEGIDGVEFCRRARARGAPTACCLIVLLDLDGTSAGRKAEAQQAGAVDLIAGPAAPAGVVGTIGVVLRAGAPAGRLRRENAHLRAQLRQAQKMEAIGRLGCGIAHDFCNQLTVIRNGCRLVLDDPRSSGRTRAVLEEIDEAADRSETLSRYLVALSRARPLGRSLVDLNAVLAEMAGPLKRLVGEDVELVLATEVGLEAVEVDRPLLEQALLNLAVNAREAMPRGGVLRIETANVPAPPGGAARVVVAVADTGAGMDADTAAQAFAPFFTTKSAGEGTGLGLAMVQAFMRQSGGEVAVESEPGVGSTFRLFFPAAPVPVAEGTLPVRQAWTGHETVLLVEDDDAVRRVLARAMTGAGYQVLAAAHAAEALDLSAEAGRPIDLVVADVVLPGLSGQELAGRLAESRPGLSVLYLSGYPPDMTERYGAGPRGELLRKPFSVESLLAAMRRVLDNPRRADA